MSGITIPSTSSNLPPLIGEIGFAVGGVLAVGGFLAVALSGFLGGHVADIVFGCGIGAVVCGLVLGPLVSFVVAKVRESLDEHRKHTPCTDAEILQNDF